jgi:hypothetical protein
VGGAAIIYLAKAAIAAATTTVYEVAKPST